MKKFFTLFALLSVGLSAWAQDYTLRWEEQESYFPMKKIEEGKYSVRKIILTDTNLPGFDVLDSDYKSVYHEYVQLWDYIDEEGGWIDLTFTYYKNDNRLEVSHNEGTVVSEGWNTTINLSDDVTIGSEGYNLNISYTRSVDGRLWGTICLPFNFSTRQNSNNATFYQLSSVTEDAMIFSQYYEEGNYGVPAGTPLVFKTVSGNDLSIYSIEGEGHLVIPDNQEYSVSGWTMCGTPVDETTIDAGWVMQRNHICEVAEDGFPIKPYRVFFTGERPSGAPLRIEVDETEGLQFVEQEDGTVKVSYDLQGRKLDDARKGLMIENGKVIMVK